MKSELQVIKDSIINNYAARTNKSKEEIGQLMSAETWYTGEEAVENGFCDRLMFGEISAEQEIENSGHYVVNRVEMNFDNYKKLCNITTKNKEVTMENFENAKDLKAAYPELCAEIEKSAKDEERKRIAAIEEATLPGYESMARDAKFTKLSSAENFAFDILRAEKRKGEQYVNDTDADVKDSHVNDVGVGASEETENMSRKINDFSVLDSVLPTRNDGGLFRS